MNRRRQEESAGPAGRRGRQREKSDAMRRRICAAAVHRLFANGYHGTSIKQVVDRAGVSLGALQHHFPTKEDLVSAVAEYLLTRSLRWFAMAKPDLAKNRAAFGDVIRRSWREQFTTDEYGALLEIMAAARTDEALRARVAPKLDDWRAAIEAELRDILSASPGGAQNLTTLLNISLCMMTGLLVHEGLLGDQERMAAMLEQWIEIAL